MSELRTTESVAPWLEMELSRQLGPVAAPEALWDRIEERQVSRREKPVSWALWPIAAALLLMASGGMAWTIAMARDPGAGMAKLAERELRAIADNSRSLDFRSDDAAEIQTWVKAKTNIDIELPAGRSAVRLLGACVIRLKGTPVAAVAYRVGDEAAALLVMEKHAAATSSRHLFSQVASAGNARLFSWGMRRQEYMIAFAGTKDPHGACLVCHVN